MVLGMGSDVRGWDVWHTLFKCIYSLLWVWVCWALGVRLLIVFIACFGCGLWVLIQ